MNEEFSAIVLAGGRSSRMGRPKAELKFGASTLLERMVAELRHRFPEIVLVTLGGQTSPLALTVA